MTDVDIAKANVDYALAEQAHARKMFPECKTVSEALAKWHATDAGTRVASGYSRANYEKLQKDNALGDAYDVLKASDKRRTDPSHGSPRDVTPAPMNIYADSASDARAEPPRDQEEALQLAHLLIAGMTYDQAMARIRPAAAESDDEPMAKRIADFMKATGTKNWDQAASAVLRKMG